MGADWFSAGAALAVVHSAARQGHGSHVDATLLWATCQSRDDAAFDRLRVRWIGCAAGGPDNAHREQIGRQEVLQEMSEGHGSISGRLREGDGRRVESMTANKLIRKLLKLKGLKIVSAVFKERAKELLLYVKPYKNGCRCPDCGRRCKILRAMREIREWHDVCVCGWVVYLLYAPK